MKHAGPKALDRLEPILAALRAHTALKEKSRGVFYRGGKAFLHFHEHGDEFFADVRFAEEFERLPATSAAERAVLAKRVAATVGDGSAARPRSTSRDGKRKRS